MNEDSDGILNSYHITRARHYIVSSDIRINTKVSRLSQAIRPLCSWNISISFPSKSQTPQKHFCVGIVLHRNVSECLIIISCLLSENRQLVRRRKWKRQLLKSNYLVNTERKLFSSTLRSRLRHRSASKNLEQTDWITIENNHAALCTAMNLNLFRWWWFSSIRNSFE